MHSECDKPYLQLAHHHFVFTKDTHQWSLCWFAIFLQRFLGEHLIFRSAVVHHLVEAQISCKISKLKISLSVSGSSPPLLQCPLAIFLQWLSRIFFLRSRLSETRRQSQKSRNSFVRASRNSIRSIRRSIRRRSRKGRDSRGSEKPNDSPDAEEETFLKRLSHVPQASCCVVSW